MNGKKKVALLIGADISDGREIRGGVVIVASFLYQQLLNSGHYLPDYISMASSSSDKKSVRLLSPTTWKSGPQLVEGTWSNSAFIHAGAFLPEFEFQRYMPRKILTALLNQYDLIQVVAGGPAIAYVTKDVNKPVCLFIATLIHLERKAILKKASLSRKIYGYPMLPLVSRVEKLALRQCDHVFTETTYAKQAILPYVDESKITVDTIGVDTQRFHPLPENQRADSYILSVGRFADVRKNIPMLFVAYALLRQCMPDAPKLILAGLSGPTETDWALARQLNVFDFIKFRQEVPPDKLDKLYQNAAIFALSSYEEGLGIVLLEALACATPVVSTRCGGPDSIVSDDIGFLVPVGDAEAMAGRLYWMLQNPRTRREMGQAGRKMVEARFSNEVIGQKYLDVYNRLLGS